MIAHYDKIQREFCYLLLLELKEFKEDFYHKFFDKIKTIDSLITQHDMLNLCHRLFSDMWSSLTLRTNYYIVHLSDTCDTNSCTREASTTVSRTNHINRYTVLRRIIDPSKENTFWK